MELVGWISFGVVSMLAFLFTYRLSRANANRAAELRRMVESSQDNLTEQRSIG
jgi:hypothetical protein